MPQYAGEVVIAKLNKNGEKKWQLEMQTIQT
jgi:hypothetical protein